MMVMTVMMLLMLLLAMKMIDDVGVDDYGNAE